MDLPTTDQIKRLACVAVEMDALVGRSKFAIFAPQDLAFGLGRMFAAYRSLDEHSPSR